MGKQFKYADRRGFRVALVAGEEEFQKQTWQLKNLARGVQSEVNESNLVSAIRDILAQAPAASGPADPR
jgi:histidyl-tRNA synthetase